MNSQPRRYFTAADAVRHNLVPFHYQLLLSKIKKGEIRAKRIGRAYWLCVEWINEYFETDTNQDK